MSAALSDNEDQFLFPASLFDGHDDLDATFWTCVRSRPRWEKRFASFMHARKLAYYLPVVHHLTFSGRKLRRTLLPLLPGFIFVKGNHDKQAFKESGCVAYLLKPRNSVEVAVLDRQIRAVRRLMAGKKSPELRVEYQKGEPVTIARGPLAGLGGSILGVGNARKFVVWVDMLGVGVSTLLGSDELVRSASVATS